MPEAKTKARISSSDGVLNLSGQLSTKDTDPSMFLMAVPNDSKPDNSSNNPAAATDSPLNLVMNSKYINENPRMKCTPVAATAKTPLPSPKIATDISYSNSVTVPTNPPNKLNYFPKTVSNFQGAPVTGHLLQRIGPFQYNNSSSGSPLVALVNPTATSVMPHGLKPAFTAQSSIPSVENMNHIVYNSMPPPKVNVTQHPPPVILLRPSTPMSKSSNYQHVMTQPEKNSPLFPKLATQTIFGNESGKSIPVATIVPNNASLVTNSQKTVTSVLSGEPVLSTNDSKRPGHNPRKKTTVTCPGESNPKRQSLGWPWYQNMNNHSMVLQPSSNENMSNNKMDPRFSVSQPLNLTLQTVSEFNRKSNHKNTHLTDMMCKYSSEKSSPSPNLVFHSSTASPIIFNSAAYSLPNQNVYLPTHSHFNLHRGFSSHMTFVNNMAALNSKPYPGAYPEHSIDLSKTTTRTSSPMRTQIDEKIRHSIASKEPPMTLKIDSIFSLADKPDVAPTRPININQKPSQKIKVKSPSKLVCKDKKPVVQKPEPRGRQPQKEAKPIVKKRPKPKYKPPNTAQKINHSIFSQKRPIQKSDITVSCHANDFKSLFPMTEEERKTNTFFKYLGLCPSSSLTHHDDCNNNGVCVGPGGFANGLCNVSKELARCFSCYVVAPKFVTPDDSTVVDVNNPPASLKILDKCSKECRHAFLNKQHATTGIVPRNGELDSSWKIISQVQKCSHARKKYCRKSKTKASGNLTGSHCRRAGCIGCSTKKTSPEKIKYFRKSSKVKTVSSSVVTKEQTRKETYPHNKQNNGKKVYTFNKKSIDNKKEIAGTDATCINILGEKNIPALRKRKTNQDRHSNAKVVKKDVTEVENLMGNGDIMESESVDEISPLVSSFLDNEDSCQTETCLMPVKKVVKPEPIALPQDDTSPSSERIQRLKEILKEKQKDLEIARQIFFKKQE